MAERRIQHPLSAAFPAMSADDFQALKDSVENVGVLNPIAIFEGQVIDGWHRYRAANDLGVTCPEVELDPGTDPRDFVLAQNKARRHITQAQLAMATTSVYEWYPRGRPEQMGTECPFKTTAELADIAGVGERSIKQAKAVKANAAPEVQEAVKRGEIGLTKAAAIAKLPAEDQAAALTKTMPKPAPAPISAPAAIEDDGHDDVPPEDDGPSAAELAAFAASDEADRLAMQKLLDSDDALATAWAEIKRLNAEVAQLKISRDGHMNKANEAIRLVKSRDWQIAKLEAKLKGVS